MDRMLYIAMTGAKQTMFSQSVNSHNLANASTTGFRADLDSFLSVPVVGAGYQSRINTVAQSMQTDFRPGTLNATGRDLDMAIKGDGWITVQAKDGSEAYTRAGDLRIQTGGLLVNGAGHPVMGNGGPIVIPPAEKLEIGVDGTISIRPIGQSATALVSVDRIKLVNPDFDQLYKGKDGLMRTRDGLPAAPDVNTTLVSGALETSNVNIIDALVKQIALARQFEVQIKAMSTVDENAQVTTQMMRIN